MSFTYESKSVIENPKTKETSEVIKETKEELHSLETEVWISHKIGSVLDNFQFQYNQLSHDIKIKKEVIVDYIKKGNIFSGKNEEIDHLLYELLTNDQYSGYKWLDKSEKYSSEHLNLFKKDGLNRRLWYIYEAQGSGKSWTTIFDEIEDKEKRLENEYKRAKSNILVDNDKKIGSNFFKPIQKIVKGVPILKKGREIIEDILDNKIFAKNTTGQYDQIGEINNGITRFFVKKTDIESAPTIKSEKTGVTLCSRTAQINGQKFGLNLPKGDARLGVEAPIIDTEHFVFSLKDKDNGVSFNNLPDSVNYADISVKSYTKNGIKYGHRASVFRDKDGNRNVFDPYYSSGYGKKAQPLTSYTVGGKPAIIQQANFYNAPIQIT